MIEFEPTYFETFLTYSRNSWMLVLCLCGVDLHSKGYRIHNSELISEAVNTLEMFIKNPREDMLLMLEDLEYAGHRTREELLGFLGDVLSILKDEANATKEGYQLIYKRILILLNELKRKYGDLEEEVLSRYKARCPLYG
jgi:hypothetical protein